MKNIFLSLLKIRMHSYGMQASHLITIFSYVTNIQTIENQSLNFCYFNGAVYNIGRLPSDIPYGNRVKIFTTL